MPVLDKKIDTRDQELWIQGDLKNSEADERVKEINNIEPNYIDLFKSSKYWSLTKAATSSFITKCIIMYAKTEREWWSCTQLSGPSMRFNVGPQEVFAICPVDASFYIHLHDAGFEEFISRMKGQDFDYGNSPYKYKHQMRIASDNPEFLYTFFQDEYALTLVRRLCLDLMRVKRNVWARSHAPELVTAILARSSSE